MDKFRRNLLTVGWLFVLNSILSSCSDMTKKLVSETSERAKNIVDWDGEIWKKQEGSTKKVQGDSKDIDLEMRVSRTYVESLKLAWKYDLEFFMQFFSIKNLDQFNAKLKEIQSNLKNKDGVLSSETLEYVYIRYYSKNTEKLEPEIRKRLWVYNDMLWYKDYPKAKTWKLKVFWMNDYYWVYNWLNKKWTLINENLFWKVPETISWNRNEIIVSDFNWQKILCFYVSWKLYLATYVSPGASWHNTSEVRKVWERLLDKYHFSKTYPKIKKNWKVVSKDDDPNDFDITKSWWAIMPYAVNIDWDIRLHWSDSRMNWNPESHGCVRVPLFYMKEVYEKVNSLWKDNVIIDTTKLY